MNESTRGGGGVSSQFTATLRRLKREGARVLVTGEVSTAVRARQTCRLLGSTREERVRVLALADGADPSAYLPSPIGANGDRVTVVSHDDTTRAVASASAEPLPPRDPTTDSLGAFYAATRAAIDDHRVAHGPFDAAELRVGVVGLGALFDRYESDRVSKAARALGDTVTDHRGMYHCHVAGPAETPATAALTPAFDARVDLRQRDGLPPEQRWTLAATDESSEWMLL